MTSAALESLKRIIEEQERKNKLFTRTIQEDGYFYYFGRKVLLTYEDTGKPTNEVWK